MEEQKERIESLKKQLLDIRIQKEKLKEKLEKEWKEYEKLCDQETGHDFVEQSDNDYHSPKKYNICKNCSFYKS